MQKLTSLRRYSSMMLSAISIWKESVITNKDKSYYSLVDHGVGAKRG